MINRLQDAIKFMELRLEYDTLFIQEIVKHDICAT
jgi:hypothetical protein